MFRIIYLAILLNFRTMIVKNPKSSINSILIDEHYEFTIYNNFFLEAILSGRRDFHGFCQSVRYHRPVDIDLQIILNINLVSVSSSYIGLNRICSSTMGESARIKVCSCLVFLKEVIYISLTHIIIGKWNKKCST